MTGKMALALAVGGGGYGVLEAKRLKTTRLSISVPNLPEAFRGFMIALVADIHHSVVVPFSFVEEAVSLTNSLSTASFTSTKQLPQAIDAFIAAYNPRAHPLAWTKVKVRQKNLADKYANLNK